MRLPKFRYAILCGSLFGLVIPLLVIALLYGDPSSILLSWLLPLWPGAFEVLHWDIAWDTPQAFKILASGIPRNVVLYVIIFTLLWSLLWAVGRVWRFLARISA